MDDYSDVKELELQHYKTYAMARGCVDYADVFSEGASGATFTKDITLALSWGSRTIIAKTDDDG
jgi:hypothetical protein